MKTNEKEILKTPVFTVVEKEFDNTSFKPIGLNCQDWVTVIVIDTKELSKANALFVKQTRWGSEKSSIEFPCGTVEKGETLCETGLRELKEETGLSYEFKDVFDSFDFNPNPAYFNNRMGVLVIIDKDLKKHFSERGGQSLDENEDCETFIAPLIEEMDNINHGLMWGAFGMLARINY